MLYALDEMGGIRERREVVDFISSQRWYNVIGYDLTPTATTNEARYRIDLAWARKDGVIGEWINNDDDNAWELNRVGRDELKRRIASYQSGERDLRKCEFFSLTFKQRIQPGHEPRMTDRKRDRCITLEDHLKMGLQFDPPSEST